MMLLLMLTLYKMTKSISMTMVNQIFVAVPKQKLLKVLFMGDLVWDKCDLKNGLSGKILNGTLSSKDSYQSQEKIYKFLSDSRVFNPRADNLKSLDKLKRVVL